MPLFRISGGRVELLKTVDHKVEKELQLFVEKNLQNILGLTFVKTEFILHGFRLDTVAFDEENRSLVIIEYKKGKDYSVIDQGFTYLNLMLTYKADFKLLLMEKLQKKINIDWSQSKVIFVANQFSQYQLVAIAIKDLPIELMKYTLYEDGLISFEQVKPLTKEVSVKSLRRGKTFDRVSKEIKIYTLDNHLKKSDKPIQEFYLKLRDEILGIDNQIQENIKKHYIGFKTSHNFVEFVFQRNALKIYLDLTVDELGEHRALVEDCSKVDHWATGDTRFKISKSNDVPIALDLIKQSYNKLNKK